MMKQLPENCQSPRFNGKNLTNRVLIQSEFELGKEQSQRRQRITYYCPAYLRLQVQNFSEMNFEDLQASINSVLVLTVNFRGLCPTLEKKIRPLLKLGFNRDDSLQIKQSSKSKAISMHVKQGGIYVYTIYKIIHVAMKPNIRLFPLNLVYLIMSVYIKDIQVNNDMLEDAIEQLNQMIIDKKILLEKMTKGIKKDLMSKKQQSMVQEKKNVSNVESAKKGKKNTELEMKQAKQLLRLDYSHEVRELERIINELETQKKQLESADNINIRFNFMDTDIRYLKMTPPAEESFGYYRLAKAKMRVQYTNYSSPYRVRKNQELNKIKKTKTLSIQQRQVKIDYSKIKPFNYAHFQVPVYKVPDVAIFTIFIPLWILAVFLLGIFFQDNGLGDRVLALASLMIAFVALIPVIRAQLPTSPNVTVVEALVYAQIITGILCFGESMDVRLIQNYQFVWNQNWFFLVSLAISIMQFVVIIILWSIHKCYSVPLYNNIFFDRTIVDFKHKKWSNENCDKHFRRKIDNYRIKVLKVSKEMQLLKESDHAYQQLEEQEKRIVLQFKDQQTKQKQQKEFQQKIRQIRQSYLQKKVKDILGEE